MEFPRIQGLDIAGRIVGVGNGVPESRIGERVLVDFAVYSADENLTDAVIIGSKRDGGFAEYVTVPAENSHPLETQLTDEELATFPTAYLTAEHMLNRARVSEGETVFITGASGGVGSALVQLARLREARVVAMVGPGKEDMARDLGAEAVVARGAENLSEGTLNAVGRHQFDVVADVVAGGIFAELLGILKPLGRYVTAGAIAGPMVNLDLRTLYLKHLELIGSTGGTHEEFSDLVEYIQDGKIKPLLAGTYPLSEIRQAQEDFKKKNFFGKLVLVPNRKSKAFVSNA